INANGGGGTGAAQSSHGAGGGGSGGAIFLESPMIDLDSGAMICANGGPGGSTDATAAPTAAQVDCGLDVCQPSSTTAGALGGVGGAANGAAGAGHAGNGTTFGGTGGGGAVGKIRIHGTLADSGAVLSPPPKTN
ncbi:MAG TPA: hypothetical protein VGM88_13670, partial [Kofleriaceae bacterium]